MYRTALRAAPRRFATPKTIINSSQRFLSTAPPSQKSRSWKSSAVRWALAAGGVYYYNTSNVFAEEPDAAIDRLDDSLYRIQESKEPTIDAIVEEKRRRQAQQAEEERSKENSKEALAEGEEGESEEGEGGLEGLEEEADQQGAFNPDTGEINWDCPCLGGMAHGPCGEEFKAAFSCFVHSTEEPKGVECIERFKGMQDCFREHPEMYGSELDEDEEEIEEEIRAQEAEKAQKDGPQSTNQEVSKQPKKTPGTTSDEGTKVDERSPKSAKPEVGGKSGDEGRDLIPKSEFDSISK